MFVCVCVHVNICRGPRVVSHHIVSCARCTLGWRCFRVEDVEEAEGVRPKRGASRRSGDDDVVEVEDK